MKNNWFVALLVIFASSIFFVLPAYAGNGAQHGYVEVTLTDENGNPASDSYVVLEVGCSYAWTNLGGNWESRTRTGTLNKNGICTMANAQWSGYTSTGETNPNAHPNNGVVRTDPCTDTQYRWVQGCGGWRLSGSSTTPSCVTFNLNAWGAVESWMSNKTFPEARGGKYSFSIGPDRVTAASWCLKKGGVCISDPVDILSNIEVIHECDFRFPPAHPQGASGPTHNSDLLVSDIQKIDSTGKNDCTDCTCSGGGDKARIMVPIQFIICEPGEYQVVVSMTIKDLMVDGSSITVEGVANVIVTTTGTAGTLCDGETPADQLTCP